RAEGDDLAFLGLLVPCEIVVKALGRTAWTSREIVRVKEQERGAIRAEHCPMFELERAHGGSGSLESMATPRCTRCVDDSSPRTRTIFYPSWKPLPGFLPHDGSTGAPGGARE